MTPEQAAFVLEPFWIAAEASMERLAELSAAAIDSPPPGQDTYKALQAIHKAQDFILAIARRMDAAHVDAVALQHADGSVVIWPVGVRQQDQAEAIKRWLEKNPGIATRRAERARAHQARLEATTRALRPAPAAVALRPLEALPVAAEGGSHG